MNGKTIRQIRLHNARLLQESVGGQDAICKILDKSQSQVSSIMGSTATKGIGNKIARQIESAFSKPEGWLDAWHDSASEIASASGSVLTIEQNVVQSSEIEELIALATPRSKSALERIALAAAEGLLTDEDMILLETITKRLINQAPDKQASSHKKALNLLKDDDPPTEK